MLLNAIRYHNQSKTINPQDIATMIGLKVQSLRLLKELAEENKIIRDGNIYSSYQ